MIERFNPDLYGSKEASKQLKKINDKQYALGTKDVNVDSVEDRAKIWSLPPEILDRIVDIVGNADHIHYLPFILGTYNMTNQNMRMNDFCIFDPAEVVTVAAGGGIESITIPLIRGLYFAGRSTWWKHESIHARHHFQMADYLAQVDPNAKRRYDYGDHRPYLLEAAHTIHESGMEEILTRWQTLHESSGVKDKSISGLALLLYLEYSMFTGIRNLAIDIKEKTYDQIDDGKIRVPAKLVTVSGAIAAPIVLDNNFHLSQQLGDVVADNSPATSEQVGYLLGRVMAYVDVALISSLFSQKEKGALQNGDEHQLTPDYKFPYVYNPASSLSRHIDFLRYLGRVWDNIPNYRMVDSRKGIDGLKLEIDDRLAANTTDRDHAFSMHVVEEALKALETKKKYQFPHDTYVRGLFIPALYLNLRDLYNT